MVPLSGCCQSRCAEHFERTDKIEFLNIFEHENSDHLHEYLHWGATPSTINMRLLAALCRIGLIAL